MEVIRTKEVLSEEQITTVKEMFADGITVYSVIRYLEKEGITVLNKTYNNKETTTVLNVSLNEDDIQTLIEANKILGDLI